MPDGWSFEAAYFINKLLIRKPQNRLGYNGPLEVKSHPWLRNFPFNKLLNSCKIKVTGLSNTLHTLLVHTLY